MIELAQRWSGSPTSTLVVVYRNLTSAEVIVYLLQPGISLLGSFWVNHTSPNIARNLSGRRISLCLLILINFFRHEIKAEYWFWTVSSSEDYYKLMPKCAFSLRSVPTCISYLLLCLWVQQDTHWAFWADLNFLGRTTSSQWGFYSGGGCCRVTKTRSVRWDKLARQSGRVK